MKQNINYASRKTVKDVVTHRRKDVVTHTRKDVATHRRKDVVTHTRKDVATHTRKDVVTHTCKDVALQRLYGGVLTILVLCTIAYTGLSAQTKEYRDLVVLKDGTVLEGVQTLVNRESLVVTKEDGTATIYLKKDVSDVTKGKAEVAVKAGQKFTSKTGIEMLPIPAGEFTTGCSVGDTQCTESEKPAHKVKITKSFYMGKYEVTQGQWKAVMGANPSSFNSCGDNCPVEQVSWDDIKQFLVKLNAQEGRTGARMFRLPTEAEWEYAARGSTTLASATNRSTKYYANDLGSIAWYSENSGSTTHPVGQKTPNAFGLYDMLGNVWEWTEDWYGANYYSASETTDPVGPSSGGYRVYRGGSWDVRAAYGRSSFRIDGVPGRQDDGLGFRVVLLP